MNDIQVFYGAPGGDGRRSCCLGDPLPGVLKSVKIVTSPGNVEQIYHTSSAVSLDDVMLPEYDWVHPPINTSKVTLILDGIHKDMKLVYGHLPEEYPEQIMSVLFINSESKVLEIGGNVGRNSCTIASILGEKNRENLVVVESDSMSAAKLTTNRDLNGFGFSIEASALSRRRLQQHGWLTIPIVNELESGWREVATISWEDLKDKYKVNFDTLVADCEGALYYIMMDYPSFLEGINLILLENDFREPHHKEYVHNIFREQNYQIVYQSPLGNMIDFYQAWRKK